MSIKSKFFALVSFLIAQTAFSAYRQVRIVNKTQETITLLDPRNYVAGVIAVIPPQYTFVTMLDTALPLQWRGALQPGVHTVVQHPQACTLKFRYASMPYGHNMYGRPVAPLIVCSSEASFLDTMRHKGAIFYENFKAGLSFGYLSPKPENNLLLPDYQFANNSYFMGQATTTLLAAYALITACN